MSMAERYLSESSVLQAVGDVHPLDYNAQGIVERIKAIPAADVVERPRWISVKERMPEDGKNVLAYEGGGFYFLDWCCDGDWVVASASTAVVTHWMPLPEPPEAEP